MPVYVGTGVFELGFVIVIIGFFFFFFFFPCDSLSSELESESDDDGEDEDEDEEGVGGPPPPLMPQTHQLLQDLPIRRISNQEGHLRDVPKWSLRVEHFVGYHSRKRENVLEVEVVRHILAAQPFLHFRKRREI